jgi:hypothetical protein
MFKPVGSFTPQVSVNRYGEIMRIRNWLVPREPQTSLRRGFGWCICICLAFAVATLAKAEDLSRSSCLLKPGPQPVFDASGNGRGDVSNSRTDIYLQYAGPGIDGCDMNWKIYNLPIRGKYYPAYRIVLNGSVLTNDYILVQSCAIPIDNGKCVQGEMERRPNNPYRRP